VRTPLATLDDLERLMGGEQISDHRQATARLADASEIVREAADTDWLSDTGELEDVPGQIPGVVANMVERASRNPGGVQQESVGPFSRSFGADAAARLYLTKSERAVVRRAAGRSGLRTIGTTRGPLETAPVECGPYGTDVADVTLPAGWPQ
jgi:hypothetical protein